MEQTVERESRPKRMRFLNRWFFLGFGLGVVLTLGTIVAIGVVIVMNVMPSPETLEAMLAVPEFPSPSRLPLYGQVDYDWSVKALDGREVALSEFKGKVVFLNFWATWCVPCVAEMPSIQSLHQMFKTDDVVFLLISDEDAQTVKEFLAGHQYDLPVYLSDEDPPNIFQMQGVPTTFIVNRDGLVVFRHVGAAKWDDEACRSFIQSLR